MGEFDLDLREAEAELDGVLEEERTVELAILDGTTDPDEWIAAVEEGNVLVLSVAGDLNELAAPFARDVTEMGGELMHFRGFLVVAPPDVDIDTARL